MTAVSIGRLARVHGVRGDIVLERCQFEIADLVEIGTFTWRGRDESTRELHLESARPIHGGILVHFTGYADRDQAMTLTRGELLVDSDRLPDPGPDLAYTFQLIGMEVRNADGRALGRLAEIWNTGAHPIYVVRGERELLVPAHAGVLKSVDRDAGVITVELPAGLEEL